MSQEPFITKPKRTVHKYRKIPKISLGTYISKGPF